jgi:VWFA-related protein
MDRRIVCAAAAAALAAATHVAGQSQPAAQPPTFKAEVEYVEVDALVTDSEGRFVRDLTRDDFQILEDGRLQTINSFSLVDIPVERADRPLFEAAPIEPDVLTNERPFDGRLYVLILDDVHTEALRSQHVKIAARQFIERNLGANDLMAIVHTGGRSETAQEFTGNKRLLLASVDKFLGRKIESATLARSNEFQRSGNSPGDPWEAERAYNARTTLTAVKSVAEWLSGVRGRRKTIIFMSEGIDYDISDIIPQYNAPTNSASMVIDDIRETIAATARSNVSIYSVDPRGLAQMAEVDAAVGSWADQLSSSGVSTFTDAEGNQRQSPAGLGASGIRRELQLSQDSLRSLADETNGFAAVNSNDFASVFARIVRDNSSYYLLAYYPSSDRRDGRFHRIQVRVSRPGLTVRARRGYVAPRGNQPPPKPPAVGAGSPQLVEALNSPLPVSGLTMRVFAAPFRAAAPNASILLGVELSGRDLSLAAGGKIELSYFAVDASGRARGGRTDNVTLNLRPDSRARVEASGLRVLNRFDLQPGRYTLRVAARDTVGGAVGSITHDLEVPDFNRLPFAISGLVLTSMVGAATPTVRPDEELQNVLPAPPIAQRSFPQNDEIALYTEIYDGAGRTPHSVDISTTVRSIDGKTMFRHEEVRQSSELQGPRGGYGYQARIALADLPPGDYVLTVEARSRLDDHPAAERQVQFTVTPPVSLATLQGAVSMRLIDKGTQSRIDARREVVARSAAEWDALWRQHAPDRPAPAIDFAREIAVGVFAGSRPTAGFAVEIVGAADSGGTLVVQYRETKPSGDAITAQVITSPYHVVALPAVAGEVRFERTP